MAESAAVWAAQSGKDCWETILSIIIVVVVACSTHHPSAGNKVIEAAVDLLQFGNKHIHATLSGFCEEILRMRGTKVIWRCVTGDRLLGEPVLCTDRALGVLADLSLSLSHVMDLALVPVSGSFHHLQACQQ